MRGALEQMNGAHDARSYLEAVMLLQHLQRGPEVRREQVMEDLRALTRRISR